MAKILKNPGVLATAINSFGVQIPAATNYTVQPQDYLLLSTATVIAELTTLITATTIVVNDGVNDLPVAQAIEFLKYPDHAKNVRFDNSTNGFVARTVQEAIEESALPVIDFVNQATNVTRSNSADALLSGMTKTGLVGNYEFTFRGDMTSDQAGQAISYSFYKNGAQVAGTLQKMSPFDGGALSAGEARATAYTDWKFTGLIVTDTIEVRWSMSGGTATSHSRRMKWLKVR